MAMRDELTEAALSDSVIIGSAEVIPDVAVQPHTLQQEFALINVNIPNVIVEQVKWNSLKLPLAPSVSLTEVPEISL